MEKQWCPDQMFNLLWILSRRHWNPAKRMFCCFIDIKKSFDKVWRNWLWGILWKSVVMGKMWRILRAVYDNTSSCVKLAVVKTDFFVVKTGVMQGWTLSPTLFAIFVNGLIQRLKHSGAVIQIWKKP